ncbi:hypothetical protein ACQKM2_39590 [Streptomyces sp. NPDC004126]|uniref:hypothetical protein n=1 Tax=Streptomyces sp. NPDC004126 TaxID=3390695 RepID=UPI003D00C879
MSSIHTGKFDLLTDPADAAWGKFLTLMGASQEGRDAEFLVSPSYELGCAGERWTLARFSELGNESVSFTLGKEVADVPFPGGLTGTATFTENGPDLVQIFRGNGKEAQVVHATAASEMITTYTTQGHSAVRKYKKVG